MIFNSTQDMHRTKTGGIFFLLLTLLVLFYALSVWLQQESYRIPRHLKKYLMYEVLPISPALEGNSLKLKIKENNLKREVRNWKKFGPVVKRTVTVVVQVHQDVKGLQYLIISLAQVRHIESVLLVFSHSYYSEYINFLINSIDFCKVMQIFYPHSVQLYPDKFPGVDPEDCINGSQTTLRPCPQRDTRSIERKHHWWWKANFIFDRMEWSPGYTGIVIFLEEDQYVAPDLLHMLQYLQRSLSYFPDVEIMSLGTMYARNLDPRLLTLEYWRPPFDAGLAFNKTTWKKIVDLSSFYCMYDDCSWSYSLLNVFKNFPFGDVYMVACVAPRVVVMKQFDNVDRSVIALSRVFSNLKLFPQKVNAILLYGPRGRVRSSVRAPPRGNGGWTNVKDHLLCLDPLTATVEDYEASTFGPTFHEYTN